MPRLCTCSSYGNGVMCNCPPTNTVTSGTITNMPGPPMYVMGCGCPAASEQTCEAGYCPRRHPGTTADMAKERNEFMRAQYFAKRFAGIE